MLHEVEKGEDPKCSESGSRVSVRKEAKGWTSGTGVQWSSWGAGEASEAGVPEKGAYAANP